ncbi:MAG TPA: inorganic phosphate transporter [Solirubrobacteraceae bacterium]|jgi:PiT family inorganic phosphate transporter|nr:inorganic phosphate transporter [Solirubrobacteraceae bacterium]
MLILILVVVTAVCFDFTNGFHDTANAVATSIATGALKPRVAVLMAAVLNLVGAFLSIKVAATIAKGIVNPKALESGSGLTLVFAALIGAIIWNLVTWYFTLPSSSSHALIGGVIGATIVASGAHAVNFHGILKRVIAPAILSPIICFIVAGVGTFVVYRLIRLLKEGEARRGYRAGQIGSAALVSLAHGTNDAQKTMGVITLALIAHGDISSSHFYVPVWVKLACALAIAAGTAIGGWRIINTMGNRLTEIESPQGFAAESASAAVILSSSFYGYPLSTTHVVSGGVMGAGAGKKLESVHWNVAGQMASAWLLTIPMAGIFGAIAWEVADLLGSDAGVVVMAILTAAAAAVLYMLAQRNKIGAADLDRTHVSPEREAQIAAARQPAPAAV